MFDTLIRGGAVVDGTGRPAFAADVAVSGGRIAAIGDLSAASAAHVIDAAGRTVTPGFIDIHRHADAALFRPGFGAAELCQGLTTIVNGNCGLSAAPFGPAHGDAIRDYLRPITGALPPELVTETLSGYFASVPNIPVHVGMLAGAGVLRADAAGYELEHLEDRHYRALHRALEQALADGALGVSLGLGYAPECFYTTAELIRALSPIAGQDIPLTVHMRQEGADVLGYDLFDLNGETVTEVSFTLNSVTWHYRMAPTLDVSETIPDISAFTGGSLTAEGRLRWCPTVLRWDAGGAGCIIWRDIAPGLAYSLTADTGASEKTLADMAALVFKPAQEES